MSEPDPGTEEDHAPDAPAPRRRVPLSVLNWGLFVLWIGLGVAMGLAGFPRPRFLWAGLWLLAGGVIVAAQWVDRMRTRRGGRPPPAAGDG